MNDDYQTLDDSNFSEEPGEYPQEHFIYVVCYGSVEKLESDLKNYQESFPSGSIDPELMRTLLSRAVAVDRVDMVQCLVESFHMDISGVLSEATGNTPLHIACTAGNLRLVEYLHSKGVDLYAVNAEGDTPLFAACRQLVEQDYNMPAVIHWLHTHAGVPVVDEQGYTLLMQACQRGEEGIVNAIIEELIEPQEESRHVLSRGALFGFLDTRSNNQSTLWHAVLENELWDIAKSVLNGWWINELIDAPNDAGNTALHTAILHRAPTNLCVDILDSRESRLLKKNRACKTCLDLAKEMTLMPGSNEEDQIRYQKLGTFLANRCWSALQCLVALDGYVASLMEHHRSYKRGRNLE